MEPTPIENNSSGENELVSGLKRRFSQVEPEIPEPDFVASAEVEVEAEVEPLEAEPSPASNVADAGSEEEEEDEELVEEQVEEIVIDGDDPAIINDVVEVVRDYGARSEDEEETEEDKAFISDDAIVLEANRRNDVDPSLILPEGSRRRRKPVDKWVHPDEAEVCIDHGYAVESGDELDEDDYEDGGENDSDPDFEHEDDEESTDEEEVTDDEEATDDEVDAVEITKYTIKAMTEHDCEVASSTEGVMVHWEFEHEKFAAHWQDPTAPLHVGEFTIIPNES